MDCQDKVFFKDVPVGSTIEIETPGTPGDFAVVADVIGPDDQRFALGPGDKVASAPLTHARTAYLVRVLVTHNLPTQTTAEVVICVRKPGGGDVHSSAIRCTSTGTSADPVDFGLWPVITA